MTSMKSPKVLLSPRGFLSPRAAVKSPEQQKREAALEALRSWAAKQKHDNYEALKVWDQKRAAWLAVHSRSLHQLKDSLQQRLENSHEFMQCVRQFLLGHCERMELYLAQSPKTPQPQHHENGKPAKIEIEAQALFALAARNERKNTRLTPALLSQLKQLARDFQTEVLLSEAKLQNCLSALNELDVELSEANASASQKCSELSTAYHAEKDKDPFRCSVDIYTLQQSFLRSTVAQQDCQNKLATCTLSLWQEAKRAEKQRAAALRMTLATFHQLLRKAGWTKVRQEIIEQLQRNMQEQFIEQSYSYEQLVPVETLNQLAGVLLCDANAIDECSLIRFLEKYTVLECRIAFPKFSSHRLVLREAEVSYRLNDAMKATETLMVVTADGFLHLTKAVHRRLDPQCKSDFMFKLDRHIRSTDLSETELRLSCTGSLSESLLNILKKRRTNTDESFEFALGFANAEQKLSCGECIGMIAGMGN